MKRLFISVPVFLSFTCLKGQDENRVFEKIELNANTNQKAWNEHIRKKSELPDSALRNIPPGTYKVNVLFVIDKHGNVGQVKAKNDPGFGLAKRAVNAISTYHGVWQPANQCGRSVNAYREQTVNFIIPAQ